MRQLWAKCPLWKHLSQELVHFCKVPLLISSLILKIFVSGMKLFSFISSKNTYLVESISKSLDTAFCFADFFWGAGSPIQEKVILFLKISRLKLVHQCLSIGLLSARPLFWSAKELPVWVDDWIYWNSIVSFFVNNFVFVDIFTFRVS